ncbi:tail tube protein [Acinetobacter phage HFM1]|nr:tail tube protein [Acinetobacter phage HFM1]
MANQIPERLINFNVYNSTKVMLGVADVELPEVTKMTDTLSGAGIGGEIESSVLGHFESMEAVINFRTVQKEAVELLSSRSRQITLRGVQQVHDASTGETLIQRVRATMNVQNKGFALGTFAPAANTDSSGTYEVTYLALYIDDQEVLVIDKFNMVFKVNGVDELLAVRRGI